MTPIVSEVTCGNIGGVSRNLVKEVLKELILEEPEFFYDALQGMLSEITERIDLTQVEQVKDRTRIADIELLLGLDDEVQDPEDPFYLEKKERLDELKQRSSFLQNCQKANEKFDFIHRMINSDVINLQ